MIKVRCHTNLDKFKHERWPEQMVAVPQKGEYVRADSGKELRVVQVTHSMSHSREFSREYGKPEPMLLIELHAPEGMEALYMRRDDR